MTEPDLDRVLRAVADPTRRQVLALLDAQPGLTTGQLAARVPGITRWGVIKHIAVLREAGLVQTLDEGRRRRHYREVAALAPMRRWIDQVMDD
ncbi:MAG TPA: helix-turn-helix domain-containing protein [Candidatus Limnocylindrales bacterium]|jgi:DNA-binding transcriptional ArsR family regulator|nr:helix-turn-helix domain-containing protein [Candidatus Limnocylindrales bacterium]